MKTTTALVALIIAVITASLAMTAPIALVQRELRRPQTELSAIAPFTDAKFRSSLPPELAATLPTDLAAPISVDGPQASELQARGSADLLDEVTSVASTSTSSKVDWRIFFDDPNFEPEVREIPSFKEAFDIVRRLRSDSDLHSRAKVRLGEISPEEHRAYTSAVERLRYYASARAIKERSGLRYHRQGKPRKSPKSASRLWLSNVSEDMKGRIGQRSDRITLDLRRLLPDEKREVRMLQKQARYYENQATIKQKRRERYQEAKIARSAASADPITVVSSSDRPASQVPVLEAVQNPSPAVQHSSSPSAVKPMQSFDLNVALSDLSE